MSKLDIVVCGLFSYQKKAPRQVWMDYGQQFATMVCICEGKSARKHEAGQKGNTMKEKKVLFPSGKLPLRISIIIQYSEYGEIIFFILFCFLAAVGIEPRAFSLSCIPSPFLRKGLTKLS